MASYLNVNAAVHGIVVTSNGFRLIKFPRRPIVAATNNQSAHNQHMVTKRLSRSALTSNILQTAVLGFLTFLVLVYSFCFKFQYWCYATDYAGCSSVFSALKYLHIPPQTDHFWKSTSRLIIQLTMQKTVKQNFIKTNCYRTTKIHHKPHLSFQTACHKTVKTFFTCI